MIKIINTSHLSDNQCRGAINFVLNHASPLFHLKKKNIIFTFRRGPIESRAGGIRSQFTVGSFSRKPLVYIQPFHLAQTSSDVYSFMGSIAHELAEFAGYSHDAMARLDLIDGAKGRMHFEYAGEGMYWKHQCKDRNINWANIIKFA